MNRDPSRRPNEPADGPRPESARADAHGTPRRSGADQQLELGPRCSVDPMRETDRYRLVTPYVDPATAL